MKKAPLILILMVIAFVMCYVCGYLMTKDEKAVAEVADEEYEVIDSFSKAGMVHLAAQAAKQYEDSVNNVFSAFLKQMPEFKSLLEEERLVWEDYKVAAYEAYRRINMNGFCGSTAPLGFCFFGEDIAKQFLVSFDTTSVSHMTITNVMIKDEYSRFADYGIARFSNNGFMDEYTLAEQQDALRAEQKAWEEWMMKREAISAKMAGVTKRRYDNCTNELKRMKLIQLKDQYQWYPIGCDDFFEHQLAPNCSDEELKAYSSFDQVLDDCVKNLQ